MLNTNGYDPNSFNNISVAIKANKSKLYIVGQDFYACDQGINTIFGEKGITTIEDNTFLKSGRAAISILFVEDYQIHNNRIESDAYATGTKRGITVTAGFRNDAIKSICNNEIIMRNGTDGIAAFISSGVKILDNSITLDNFSNSGIVFQGGNGCQVEDNRISNFTTENSARGIFVNGTNASTFGCNRLSKNETGINFFGVCENTDLKGSIIKATQRGLTLGEWPDVGGTIISPQDHRGNEWSGNFSDVGAYFVGLDADAELSAFKVYTGTNDTKPQLNPTAFPTGWFTNVDDENSTFVCPSNPTPSGDCDLPGVVQEGPFETELDDQLAGGFTIPGFTAPTTTWILNRHLVQRIQKGQTTLTNTISDAYLSNNATASFKTMERVREWLLPPTNDQVYQENVAGIINKQSVIEAKLIELSDGYIQWLDGSINDSQLDNLVTTTKAQIGAAVSTLQAMQISNLNTQQQRQNTALALNNAVNDNLLPAENEKVINALLINGVQESDFNTLENIAIQCPLDGGDAVYTARGLLNTLGHNLNFDDGATCNAANRQVVDTPTPSSFLTLYPNPANRTIKVRGLTKENDTELLIFNWTGSLIKNIPLTKGTFNETLAVENWPIGIYYYTTNEKDAQTHKLVITH